MNTSNPAVEPAPAANETPATRCSGLLGGLAVVLWIAAVCLGILAPLAGIRVDSTLLLTVLIASGVSSLLSLPMAAGMFSRGLARPPRG
jgi:hypothetical protein